MAAEPPKKVRSIKCPRCGKQTIYSEENIYRPFCGKLCQLQDQGAWAFEEYRVAAQEQDDDEADSVPQLEDEETH